MIVAAEVFGNFPVSVLLALAPIALLNTLITNRAGLLGSAVVKLGEAAAAALEPGGEVVCGAFLLVAGFLLPEAAAPIISPVAFFLGDALEFVAVLFFEEAAASALVPSRLHSPMALLLAALVFVQHADAGATEQEGRLGGATLLQSADPLLGLAAALFPPEEANLIA